MFCTYLIVSSKEEEELISGQRYIGEGLSMLGVRLNPLYSCFVYIYFFAAKCESKEGIKQYSPLAVKFYYNSGFQLLSYCSLCPCEEEFPP